MLHDKYTGGTQNAIFWLKSRGPYFLKTLMPPPCQTGEFLHHRHLCQDISFLAHSHTWLEPLNCGARQKRCPRVVLQNPRA